MYSIFFLDENKIRHMWAGKGRDKIHTILENQTSKEFSEALMMDFF